MVLRRRRSARPRRLPVKSRARRRARSDGSAPSRASRRCRARGWRRASGSGCSSSGTCASRRCVSMSPAFEASTLPSIASEVVPPALRTATVPVGAFAVIQQLARGRAPCARSGAAQHAPRTCRRRSTAAADPSAAARRPGRATATASAAGERAARGRAPPRDQHDASAPAAPTIVTSRMVPCRPSHGNQHEARQQRAGDGARGVDGVDQPEIGGHGLVAAAWPRRRRTETRRRTRWSSARAGRRASSAWRSQDVRVKVTSGWATIVGDGEQRRDRRAPPPPRRSPTDEREADGEADDRLPRCAPTRRDGDRRADGEPGDEDRHDGAERVGRRAEDQREEPRPDHLQRRARRSRRRPARPPQGAADAHRRGRRGSRAACARLLPLRLPVAALATRSPGAARSPAAAHRVRRSADAPGASGGRQTLSATPTQVAPLKAEGRQQHEAGERARPAPRRPCSPRTGSPHPAPRGRRAGRTSARRPGRSRPSPRPGRQQQAGSRRRAAARTWFRRRRRRRPGRGADPARAARTAGPARARRWRVRGRRSDRSARRPGSAPPARPPARRAERQPAHERGQHRAGGRDAVAELQGEEARPGDFVDESRRAGSGEDQSEPRTHPRRGYPNAVQRSGSGGSVGR